jgi:pimeloyl-ACP methyl ester carboxylesterase
VLGHSILGVLAIEYGRRCPDTVSAIIAVGTPPRGDMAWLSETARTFFEQDASDDRKVALRENLASLPANASFVDHLVAQTPTRFFDPRADTAHWYDGAIVKPALLGGRRFTEAWRFADDASSLRVPILLAHGRYDYTVPHVLWDGIASSIPEATFHLFERSGHHPFAEEPERFVEAVTGWMAGGPARR